MIAREVLPLSGIAAEVASGLLDHPKSLPPKLFYDQAGSALFERITKLPEYYLTRTETEVLEASAGQIAKAAGAVASLVELGAGTSAKTGILIAPLLERQPGLTYFPVDISASPLRAGQVTLESKFPKLRVSATVADFVEDLSCVREIPGQRLVLYLGSSIGNFEPAEALAFLSRLRAALDPGDALLLGTDMPKDPRVLVPAYDDPQGVTAAFNKNVLARINREMGGHFDLETFRHKARWNSARSRMEMHLESLSAQDVHIDRLDLTVHFERGETIHTESSYKYTSAMVCSMLQNAGFRREQTWKDTREWFCDHLARVPR